MWSCRAVLPGFSLVLSLGIFPGLFLSAQEPPRRSPAGAAAAGAGAEVPAPAVSVEKVGETAYRLGGIEFDAKTREIRLPVTVNFREGGPVEYLLVREDGKVHESILTTPVSPLHLQIALKLLRYRAGQGDVFNAFLPSDLLEKEGGKEADRGETVSFFFRPEGGDELPLHELVIDGESAEAMSPGGWVYTGSVVEDGSYMAEVEGSIIAVYLDPLALFNMTREGADIDERWGARHSVIPEIGSKGVLSIRPGFPVTKSP